MPRDPDPGVSLPRHQPLADGSCVTLRLVRPSDADGLLRLLQGAGMAPAQLELRRLVSFDPRRRLVVCAAALIDSTAQVVGVGEIELGDGGGEPPEPALLVVDEELAEGVEPLLRDALVGQASVINRARAA